MDAISPGRLVFHILNLLIHVLHPNTDRYVLVLLLNNKFLYCWICCSRGLNEYKTLQRRKSSASKCAGEQLDFPHSQSGLGVFRPSHCKRTHVNGFSLYTYGTHTIQVAYLPNEAEIIKDRVRYALDEIVYPRTRIRINLVYNTPIPIEPLETELSNLALRVSRFRSIKVPGSTSKADNLNYFFSLNARSDITAIFDADHYPHPYGPRWAAERFMQDPKTDLVQGRCIIFNTTSSWLSAMISVEFDKIYAVSHPGRAALWGFGVFTGSNGYWRTPLLHKMQMDGTVLTEDIDSAMRAIGEEGAKIVHDLNVTSYELAPTSIPALWKQRLRWAQGWTQVSLHHCPLTFTKCKRSNRNLKTRLGLLFLLLIREFSYYLVTQYFCLIISLFITNFPKTGRAVADVLFFPFAVSQWLFIIR